MALSGTEYAEIVAAIPTAGWAFAAAAVVVVGVFYVFYRFPPKASQPDPQQPNLSWDAMREQNEKLTQRIIVLQKALARSRGFAGDVIAHVASCEFEGQPQCCKRLVKEGQELIRDDSTA